jgi:RNA polymerase sigma-70 factor (ECF subfamily)
MASRTGGTPADDDVEVWIKLARTGSAEALGRLLEVCRPYLLLVANQELPTELRGKMGASDLVQETCLRAHHHFEDFHDEGRAELVAWLRRILLNNVADQKRRYSATEKRRVSRELSLPVGTEAEVLDLPAPGPSPSSMIAATERDEALEDALLQLPENYRQVLTWRNFDRVPYEEIGRRLDRSPEAARKLWVRAIEQLQQILSNSDERD